jgi:oligopeptide transport system substrate-binding protein
MVICATLILLGGCDDRTADRAARVSVIGPKPALVDSSRTPGTASDRALADSLAQGLVRFDAAGEIEPGLAARWIVIDDGRTYIFRLRRMRWPDGRIVTAADVVAAVRRQIAVRSQNPLKPYLTAIEAVRAMTPDVVEIDLSRPRPDLLKLFAQPDLAIWRRGARGMIGTGPFAPSPADPLLLTLRPEPDRAEDERDHLRARSVRLAGESAGAAILRFREGASDLVLGGTLLDWPVLEAARVNRSSIRMDPAAGILGLAIVRREGFLAEAPARGAVAEAIDRAAIAAAFSREWVPTEQLLPEALDSAAAPAIGSWAALSQEDRIAEAQRVVAEWREREGRRPMLRVAMPEGAGASRLWARLATDLIRIGIRPERVAIDADADLRLVDAVAPYDSARWYLATACATCDETTSTALEAARLAPTLTERATAIAAADAALAADTGFIPIARPFRWSLVTRRLRQWQPNARASHPLNRLLAEPN